MCLSLYQCRIGFPEALVVTALLNKSCLPYTLNNELSDCLNLRFQVDKSAIVQFKVKRGYQETHNKKTEGIPTVHDYVVMLKNITEPIIKEAKGGGPL